MSKFIKWLFKSKRRSYKFEYIARGFMGNSYSVGVYEFKVSDGFLKEHNYESPQQYGFAINLNEFGKYFPKLNPIGLRKFTAIKFK